MNSNKALEFIFLLLSKLQLKKLIFKIKGLDKLNSNFIILEYHSTSQETFREQMLYLSKEYKIISYDDFLFKFNNKLYPDDPTFVITFDDGFNDIYSDIFPVCKELNVPIIVFLTTENIINKNLFWWEEVTELNKLGGNIDKNYLKSLTSIERRKILDTVKQRTNYEPKVCEVLNETQIVELSKNNLITFGSHTVTHTNLAVESDEQIRFELTNSKLYLENLIEKEIWHLSYPNGDYSSKVIQICKEAGYKTALREGDSWVSKNSNVFEIPRVGAGLYGVSANWLESRLWRASLHKVTMLDV